MLQTVVVILSLLQHLLQQEVQILHLFAQTSAQVMVPVLLMEAVIVTMDLQVVIVQFLLAQTFAQIMVSVEVMAVIVSLDGQAMIV